MASMGRPWRMALTIAGVLLGAVILCEILGWPFLRQPAESLLSRQLDRPVRIDAPFSLRLFGRLRLEVGRLWIAAPPAFAIPHFVEAEQVKLALGYGDLLALRRGEPLHLAALDVGRIDARFLRTAAGDATWQFAKPDPDRGPPPLPSVDRLAIRQGTLTFRDPKLETDLEANFDTREGTANAAPLAHAEAAGQFRRRPFRGQLTTNGWLPAAAQGTDAPPVEAQGWLTYGGVRADFDGTVADLLGRQGIKGSLTVQGPSLSLLGSLVDKPLPTTSAFKLQGHIDKQQDAWRITVASARIGESDLAGNFTYDPSPKPPRLTGELTGKRLVLADLGPAFGTRNEEGKPVMPPAGRVIPNRPLDLPSLKGLDAHIRIDLERVDLGRAFAQPITPLKAVLKLDRGQLAMADVDARTAKGRLTGSVSVDARVDVPRWHIDLAWDGIRLEDWLKPAGKAKGKAATAAAKPSSPNFTGILHGRAKLSGTGKSTAELLASLNGEATAFVRDGSLSHLVAEVLGLDLAQALGLVVKGDDPLPVRCAVVDFLAEKGVMKPRVAVIDTPVTLVLADGSVNLAKERLDLRLVARPRNVSPFTVRSPIRIHGAFQDPAATPEPGPIAARVVAGVALAAVAPLAAILPFIDPGEDSKSPCSQALAGFRH